MLMIPFFLPADSGIIENVKWDLVAFESLISIKINYDKTEMVSMNLTEEETHQYAALICCNISYFPIIYLGLPVHDMTLRVSDWDEVVAKVQNKLANWKGALLSLGVGSQWLMLSFLQFPFTCYHCIKYLPR
jgi:hypothetical protein